MACHLPSDPGRAGKRRSLPDENREMNTLGVSELLFYGGIGIMILAAAGGITAAVLLMVSGKNLKKQLDQEFGKKRH